MKVYNGKDMNDLNVGKVVLELKFKRGLPPYIGDAIRLFNLKRVPFLVDWIGSQISHSHLNQKETATTLEV